MSAATSTPGRQAVTPARIDDRFAQRLQQIREFRGLSRRRLGQLMRTTDMSIMRAERGDVSKKRRKVSIGEAVALSLALQVPLGALLRPELDLNTLPPWVES